MENKVIKKFQNDREIYHIEKLNKKYFFYTEKEMNNLLICSLSNIFTQLKTTQQISLSYDCYQTKYLKDGETIISFGYDSVEGEPVMGNAFDYIKFFIDDFDIEDEQAHDDKSDSKSIKSENIDLSDKSNSEEGSHNSSIIKDENIDI